MQLDGHVQALHDDLVRVAAVGNESTARAAELLTAALESAFGRRLQEALAEAALELSTRLESGRVEVRVAGGDPELVYVGDAPPAEVDATDEALGARITLRLPESLKSQIETAAAARRLSVNTWVVQTLARALEPRPAAGRSHHRLTGYGKS
jgi:hypothetical protein